MPANGAERVVGDDVSYEAVARPTSRTDTGQLRSGSRTGRAAVEPWMRVRQIAWIRMSNGGWLAVVLVPASSANRRAAGSRFSCGWSPTRSPPTCRPANRPGTTGPRDRNMRSHTGSPLIRGRYCAAAGDLAPDRCRSVRMCSSKTSSSRSATPRPRTAIHADNLTNAFTARLARSVNTPPAATTNPADQPTSAAVPPEPHDLVPSQPPLDQIRSSLTPRLCRHQEPPRSPGQHRHPPHRHNPNLGITGLSPQA
jgi:hypothetical protein